MFRTFSMVFAIAAAMAAQAGRADAQSYTQFRDNAGRPVASSTTQGNITRFRDNAGRPVGQGRVDNMGVTRFYDNAGRPLGSAVRR